MAPLRHLFMVLVGVGAFPWDMQCNLDTLSVNSFTTSRMATTAQSLKATTFVTVTSSSPTNTYVPGETYTVTVAHTFPYDQKAQVTAGILSGGTANNNNQGPRCQNTYPETQSNTYTWIAPSAGSGPVEFHIVVGNYDNLYKVPTFTMTEATASPTITMHPTAASVSPTQSPVVPTSSPTAPTCADGPLETLLSYPCSFSTKGFTVDWAYNTSHLSLQISQSTGGWVGFGFGDRMVDSHAAIGWCTGTANVNVEEYFLGGRTTSSVNIGNTILYQKSCSEVNGKTSVRYVRPLSSPDRIIDLNGDNKVIMAWGSSDSKSTHSGSHSARASINFKTGTGKAEEENKDAELAHGSLMWLAFAFFMPVGAFMPSLGKICLPKYWFYIHAMFQMTAGVLALIGMAIALASFEEPLEGNHGKLGVTLFVLAAVQIIAGSLFRPKKTDIPTCKRNAWYYGHLLLGFVIIFLGCLNVYSGLSENGEDEDSGGGDEDDDEGSGSMLFRRLHTVWLVILALTLVGTIIWVIYKRYKSSKSATEPKQFDDEGKIQSELPSRVDGVPVQHLDPGEMKTAALQSVDMGKMSIGEDFVDEEVEV
mmetsp:Transcript_16119/g.24312  ORF Transcript_16119/g.24312 Transcript_16119/m.24312 type:complete len:591 (+) Transcript_16119:22-1794(+)